MRDSSFTTDRNESNRYPFSFGSIAFVSVIHRKGSTFKKTYLNHTLFDQTWHFAHRKVWNSRTAVLKCTDDFARRQTINLVTYSPGSTLIRVICNSNTKPVVFHGLIVVCHKHASARKDRKQFHMKKLVSFFSQQFKSALSCRRLNAKCIKGTETIFNPSYLTTDTLLFNFWFLLLDKEKDLKERRKAKISKNKNREKSMKASTETKYRGIKVFKTSFRNRL